jgi:hypothetical protein
MEAIGEASDVRKLFGLATTYVCLGQGRALYTPTPAPSTKKAEKSGDFCADVLRIGLAHGTDA